VSLKNIKETIEKEYPAARIVGFNEMQANDFKLLGEINNQYIALLAQFEQSKKNLVALSEILENFNNGKVPASSLIVPFGAGLMRIVQPDEQSDIVLKHQQALEQEKVKLAGLMGQIMHKGDALGEQRMRVMHSVLALVEDQHNLSKDDILQRIAGWWHAEIIMKKIEPPKTEDIVKNIVNTVKEKQEVDA